MPDLFSQYENERKKYALPGEALLETYEAKRMAYAVGANPETLAFKGIEIDDDQARIIADGLRDSKDPEGDAFKWANALQYSRMYNDPLDVVMANLDAYNQNFLNKAMLPKTATKAVFDQFSMAIESSKLDKLGDRIRDGGGLDKNLIEEYKTRLAGLNKYADNVERTGLGGFGVELLKAGAQGIVSSAEGGIWGGLALAGGVAVGAISGGTLSPVVLGAIAKVGGAIGSYKTMDGTDYMRMLLNGVDHDTATGLSMLGAAVKGAVEVALGADAQLVSALTKGGVGAISTSIATKLFLKGVAPTVAVRGLVGGALMTFEEAMEEGVQSLTDSAVDLAAAELMEKNGIKIDRPTMRKAIEDALESAKGGAMAAPVLGVLGGAIQARTDYKALKAMQEVARDVDRETFKRAAKADPATAEILGAIPADQQDAALDKVWDKEQKKAQAEAEKIPENKVVRLPSGALHTQEHAQQRPDGTVDAAIYAGNPQTGERYADLSFEIADDGTGPKILLKDSKASVGIGLELLVELGSRYRGIPIQTNELSTPAARELATRATNGNPNGPQAGAQWFKTGADEEEKTKAFLRARLVEGLPKMSAGQTEVAISLLGYRAQNQRVTLKQYLESTYRPEILSTDEAFLKEQGEKAGQAVRSGVAYYNQEGALLPFETVAKDARAIVYLSRNSNFKSWLHESGHIWRRQTVGTELGTRLEALYGVRSGVWTREQEEQFVSDLEAWTVYGKARSEEMKGVLWQISQWLKSIFQALKISKAPISDDIDRAMADLFTVAESPLSQEAPAETVQAAQGEAAAPEAAPAVAEAPAEPVVAQESPAMEVAKAPENIIERNEAELGKNGAGMLNPDESPVEEIPLVDIGFAPDLPQFKEGANTETGVVAPIQGEKYLRLPKRPIVLWRRKTGELHIITGRHRLDLAKRLAEKTIPAQIVQEDEEHDLAWAATFDAESNILDEKGAVSDYVSYFRGRALTRQEASSRGLLGSDKGRKGFAIGRYAEEVLFQLFRSDRISDTKAAAIAEGAPNDAAAQAAAIKRARDLSPPELQALARMLHENKARESAGEQDMFGFDDSAIKEAESIATAAMGYLSKLSRKRNALDAIRKAGKTADPKDLAEFGVESGDPAAMKARVDEYDAEIARWKGWITDPELMAQARAWAGVGPAPALSGASALFEPEDLFAGPDLVSLAEIQFGYTSDPVEAGYVLPNGKMLDFSGKGKIEGTTGEVPGGTRRLPHEAITTLKESVLGFMSKTGAMKVDFELGAAYSVGIPSRAQVESLVTNCQGELWLYLDSNSGEYLGKKLFFKPSAEAVEAFYRNPTKPENLTLFSDEELGPRVLKGQGLLFEGELPDPEFYKYQDSHMEVTHKSLLLTGETNAYFVDKVENAGDIGRELSGKQRWADPSYIGEKLRKLQRVVDMDLDPSYWDDFIAQPESPDERKRLDDTMARYADEYNAYPGNLGTLGVLSKELSLAVVSRQYDRIRTAFLSFLAAYNRFRTNVQGFDEYPGIKSMSDALRAEYEAVAEGLDLSPAEYEMMRQSQGYGLQELADLTAKHGEQEATRLNEAQKDSAMEKILAEVKSGLRNSRGVLKEAAFRKWFKKSKVVDDEGKPLKVYHAGTFNEEEDEAFDTTNGVHFGTKKAAEARIGGKYVDDAITSSEIFEEDGRFYLVEDEWPNAPANGFASKENAQAWIAGEANAMFDNAEEEASLTEVFLSIEKLKTVKDQGADWATAIATAKEEGYEGIVYTNRYEDKGSKSYIAFYPTQIKSVNNRGTWDENDARLLFEYELPPEGKEELKAWVAVYSAKRELDAVRLEARAAQIEKEGNPGEAAAYHRQATMAASYATKAKEAVAHLLSGNPLFVSRETFGGKESIQYGILHRSSREPGKYQFSQFDNRGPFTHWGPGTMADLMPEILTYGYEPAPTTEMLFEKDEEPALAEGMVRLYRGETNDPKNIAPMPEWMRGNPDVEATLAASGRWFNQTKELADYYVNTFGLGDGRVTYVDIPREDLEKYRASNLPESKFSAEGRAEEEFYLPKGLADARKPLKGSFLFETIEEVSSAIQDEFYVRDIKYEVNFSRSSLSRYYSFTVPTGEQYTIRVSDHPSNAGTQRWRKIDWFVNVKSPESVAKLGHWLQSVLGPAPFRGAKESTRGSRGGGALFEEGPDSLASPENPFRKSKGKFVASLQEGDALERFLTSVWDALQKDYDPNKKGKQGTKLERRLASHPFVLGAVYKMGRGQGLSKNERSNILSTIQRNELAFKEIAADVTGNLDLHQEVRKERAGVVGQKDIKAPKMKGYLEMTVAERTALLNKIRDSKVRERIDSGEITDDEILDYITRLNEDRKKLRTARKAMEEDKEQEASLREALDSARKESKMAVRQVVGEIRAMQKLREERARFVKRILAPLPKKGMDYQAKTVVKYIQQYLKAKKWATEATEAGGTVFTGEVTEPKVPAGMAKLFKDNPDLEEYIKNTLINRINDKPMSSWTNAELKELMVTLDAIRKTGIAVYREKKEARLAADSIDREATDTWLRGSKYFIPPSATGSDEERKALRDLDRSHLVNFNTMNMDRFSEYFLDRFSKTKTNHRILIEEERAHRRAKFLQVERRINRIVNAMRDRGMKPEESYRKILVPGSGPRQTDSTLSAWRLMFAYAAMKNEKSASAYIYGNLFDENERRENDDETLEAMAEPRVDAINRAIAEKLTDNERQIAEEILKDGNDEFDRVNQAAIDMTEEELEREENYIHIQRVGIIKNFTSDDPTSREIVEELFARNGISYSGGPAKGHTISRISITPSKQTKINDDLWTVFLDTVEKQEHLIEYGKYHQKLQSIYLDKTRSGSIREAITHTLGKHGMDYIERYIGEIANPISYKDRDYSEGLIRKIRGGVSIGYLAWRWVSVANQIVTSPLPYVAYAPIHMAGAAGELISNPKRFIEEVEGMSVILRHRQIDPIFERVKNLDREGWEGVTKAIGEKGMLGLTFADRWSVALGWKAVYNKHMAETHDHDASVLFADDITFKSQPSAYGADLSPLFRDNNEWKRIVTQFGTQLNVIWQQLRYDTVLAKRDERYGEMIGIAMATIMGGLALGIVRKLRGKDKPKDPEDWWVDWLYYSLSQGFNSVPLIGGEFAATAKRIMTGEFTWQENDNFPAITSFFSAAERISKLEGKTGENLKQAQWKIFEDLIESGMMFAGLPALAFKEYVIDPVEELTGDK